MVRPLGLALLLASLGTAALAADKHTRVDAILCDDGCRPLVLRVWDGDTLLLGPNSGAEKVRLAAIDAPEVSHYACAAEREAALRSKARLAQLLAAGPVAIRRDGRDRYGRTLATLEVAGVNVGDALIAEGLAIRYVAGERRERAEARWCGR